MAWIMDGRWAIGCRSQSHAMEIPSAFLRLNPEFRNVELLFVFRVPKWIFISQISERLFIFSLARFFTDTLLSRLDLNCRPRYRESLE